MITVAIGQSYDGPLDVLLALVRRESYPIDRLPVAEITRQYLCYLEDRQGRGVPGEQGSKQGIDVEQGAEFFETASWLVLLKSRALLPQVGDGQPPEQELARVLLDHEALRVAAGRLRDRLDEVGLGAGPGLAPDPAGKPEPASTSMSTGSEEAAAPTVHDVLIAAQRAVAQARAHAQGASLAEADQYPAETLHRMLEERLTTLAPGRGVSTEPWFTVMPDAQAQSALLLALLELARLGHVLLAQREPLGPVLLRRLR